MEVKRVFGVIDYEKVYQFRALIDERIKEIDEDIKRMEGLIRSSITTYESMCHSHTLNLMKIDRLKFVDMLHKYTEIMNVD